MLLPITLIGPIRFLGGTADAFRWAHCIGGCCCQLLHFGPLYFWRVLLMHSDRPIALAMLLPITSLGPITFLRGTPNAFACIRKKYFTRRNRPIMYHVSTGPFNIPPTPATPLTPA